MIKRKPYVAKTGDLCQVVGVVRRFDCDSSRKIVAGAYSSRLLVLRSSIAVYPRVPPLLMGMAVHGYLSWSDGTGQEPL